MYDMILENGRRFLDVPPEDLPTAKKSDAKNKGKPQEQVGGRSNQDDACFQCGSKDHWIRDCPHRQQQQSSPQTSGTKKKVTFQPKPGTAIRSSLKPKNSPKGTKGQSKGKGKDATKKLGQKTKGKRRNKPSAKMPRQVKNLMNLKTKMMIQRNQKMMAQKVQTV